MFNSLISSSLDELGGKKGGGLYIISIVRLAVNGILGF